MFSALTHAQVIEDDDDADENALGWQARAGAVTDYVARGLTQTWHRPALQANLQYITRAGFYTGTFVSNVSQNSYAGGIGAETDFFAGYSHDISNKWWVEAEAIGYVYPGANWRSANCDVYPGCPNKRFDTAQLRLRSVWGWLSTRFAWTLTDYFGDGQRTGFTGKTRGTWYWEWNALYPLRADPRWRLEGHVGYTRYAANFREAQTGALVDPSYWDTRVGVSRELNGSWDNWRVGLALTAATNRKFYDDTRSLIGVSVTDLGRPTLILGIQRKF